MKERQVEISMRKGSLESFLIAQRVMGAGPAFFT
jgi:hypothetical protein